MTDSWIVIIIAISSGVVASLDDGLFRAIVTTEIVLIYFEMLRR